jgi:hypothetical protein
VGCRVHDREESVKEGGEGMGHVHLPDECKPVTRIHNTEKTLQQHQPAPPKTRRSPSETWSSNALGQSKR